MKRKVLNSVVVILFAACLSIVGYIDSLKVSVADSNLILDVPDNFVTEINTAKSVRAEEIADNKTTMNKNEIVSDVDDMLEQLPNGVSDMLASYTFLVTEKNIVDVYHVINPSEMFSSFNMFKAVVIYDKQIVCLSANDAGYRDSLYHEIGHVVDYSLGWVSDSDEFSGIYEREIDSFRTNISEYPFTRTDGGMDYQEADWFSVIDNQTEFFAESFNNYFLHGDILKEYCPETYAYLNSLIDGLDN